MQERTPQFESYAIEGLTSDEKVLIQKLRSAYTTEMSLGDFNAFKTEIQEEFRSREASFWAEIRSSTGVAQAAHESALVDFYLRSAALLAAGGFILDAVELLTEKRKELLEIKRAGSHAFRFQQDFSLLMLRLENAAENYKPRVIEQYIRDIDYDPPSLSPQSRPKTGIRSMLS